MVTKEPKQRTDQQLFSKLAIPHGLKKDLPAVLGISKPALYRCLRSNRLLDLDRLIKLHEFLLSQSLKEQCKELREEIRVRHPQFSEALGVHIFGLGEPFAFDEMWIFTNHPRELADRSFREEVMRGHYEASDRRLVYFVPNTTLGGQLLGAINETTTSVKELYIVSSFVVTLMPHSVIYFQKASESDRTRAIRTLIATGHETFIHVPEDYANRVISTLYSANLLGKSNQFRWPGHSGKLNDPSEQVSFTLVFPKEL